ncbi:hypothetical protein K8S19_05890 [bacterium]|nr:hypothetical protein [bacterium]
MIISILFWGLVAGLIHFIVVGGLYQNSVVAGIYKSLENHPGMKQWPDIRCYLSRMFLGTQVEIYIFAAAYVYLRQFFPAPEGWMTALTLAGIFAAIRIYPRSFAMWIQSSYPAKLIAIETVNGTLGTFVIVLSLKLLPL